MINSSAVNTQTVGGQGIAAAYGDGPLALVEQTIQTTNAVTDVLLIEQKVAKTALGAILLVEQEVVLSVTGDGALMYIEQSVNTTASGSILDVEQRVREIPVYEPPFQLFLTVSKSGTATFEIDPALVIGEVRVTREENASSLLDFTIRPAIGTFDELKYEGKTITLDVKKGASTTRIFRGVIDQPDVDLIAGTVTMRCSNLLSETYEDRAEDGNTDFSYVHNGVVKNVSQLGYWSQDVFGERTDLANEIEDRLTTVEAAMDYAPNGVVYLADWNPNNAAVTHTFGNADVYRRQPEVTLTPRGRVTNRVNIDYELQYQRLRYRERYYSFRAKNPINGRPYTECTLAGWGILAPSMENLTDALDATGLPYQVTGSTNPYNATGQANPSCYNDNNCGLQADLITAAFPYIIDDPSAYIDFANFTVGRYFAQNISEKIAFTIEAPQSNNRYGKWVAVNYNCGIRADFDSSAWESNRAISSASALAAAGLTQSANGDWFIDATYASNGEARYNESFEVQKARGIARIRGSHRKNRVMFETDLYPNIDLKDAVDLNTNRVDAFGKVYAIEHVFNISDMDASTTITLALSRVNGGSATDTDVVANSLRTVHVDPTVSGWSSARTMVSKALDVGAELPVAQNGFYYQHQQERSSIEGCQLYNLCKVGFNINVDGVEDSARADIEFETASTMDITIRDDELVIKIAE